MITCPETLRKICNREDTKAIVRAYIDAVNEAKNLHEEMDGFYAPFLREFGFLDHDGNIITDSKDLYLTSDGRIEEYFEVTADAIEKAGYDVDRGQCPVLVADCKVRDARKKMINHLAQWITDMPYDEICWNMDVLEKYTKLILDMVPHGKKVN